ncbi:DEAD-domain-containing protein, partial [Piedraia hortae CBS 480.64]
AKYEFNGEFGDVLPEIPALEEILFDRKVVGPRGEHFANLPDNVVVEGPKKISPVNKARFVDAGLHPVVVENTKKVGYDDCTPIQRYTIPAVLQGSDVVGIAQTGSGKTAAYLVPILSNLMGKAKELSGPKPGLNGVGSTETVRAEPLVVVVVPTRELAIQIFDEARRMCYRSMLRPAVSYGGFPLIRTIMDLKKGCDVLIATPGRLCNLMEITETLSMSRVRYTVIDEADEMLQDDWNDELHMVMSGGDRQKHDDHQFLMFSATFPGPTRRLARKHLSPNYVRIKVGRVGSTHINIQQKVMYVDGREKQSVLQDMLLQSDKPCLTLIFCNSKAMVDTLDQLLWEQGLPTTSIHGGRGQREREDALRAFRTGRCPILVATGISARGWDIKGCEHVINYDLPSASSGGINEYIHRIGRTARIGRLGRATSFYNERNEDLAPELVKVLIECGCEVPDFLEQYKPEGELDFEDNSDEE